MSAPVVSINNLSVSYGRHKVIDDLSFDLRAGEITGLLGPNGAGKTTLVKTLCGKIQPSAGSITLCGKPVRRGSENRQNIGFVPQDIGLYGHLSARENLDVFARMLGVGSAARRRAIDEALETVGLMSKDGVPISQFSGGMKRRINYAAAILHKPALLILDEPTAGVDIPNRDAIHHLSQALTQRGLAVLLITHELEQAEMICDRILMLASGRSYGFDTPKVLLANHFGDAFECRVTLDSLVGSQGTDLSGFGFTRTDMDHVWCKALGGSEKLDPLRAEITQAGFVIKDISLARQGLPALMHKIEGETIKQENAS